MQQRIGSAAWNGGCPVSVEQHRPEGVQVAEGPTRKHLDLLGRHVQGAERFPGGRQGALVQRGFVESAMPKSTSLTVPPSGASASTTMRLLGFDVTVDHADRVRGGQPAHTWAPHRTANSTGRRPRSRSRALNERR